MWHTSLPPRFFIYYEAYTNQKGVQPCWITRKDFNSPYVVFFCDGWHKVVETRGSMKNARALAAELITKYNAA